MTVTPAPDDPRPLRRALLVVPLVLLFAGWLMLQSFIPYASRECMAHYRAARTAQDSARVDHEVPRLASDDSHEAFSCGAIRAHARWW